MKKLTLTLLFSLLSSLAMAGEAYKHPSPAAAADMLAPPGKANAAQLKNEGKVLQNIKAAEYSYLEVQQGKQKRWLAVTQSDVKPGAVVRFEDGMEMTNFYSKTLKRSFPSVLFIGQMAVVTPKK